MEYLCVVAFVVVVSALVPVVVGLGALTVGGGSRGVERGEEGGRVHVDDVDAEMSWRAAVAVGRK